MRTAEARIELVTYRTENIAEASVALIQNFVKYSKIFEARQWVGAMIHTINIIEQQKPIGFSFGAEGIRVSFSGFPNPAPTKDNEALFAAKEPRFTIEDLWEDVLPRQRTNIFKSIVDIGEEMSSVYHLRREYPPYTLVFPKELYAKERAIVNTRLILPEIKT